MNSIPKSRASDMRTQAPSKQSGLLGYVRISIATICGVICTLILTLIGLFNLRFRGVPLTAWTLIPFLRIIHLVFGVKIDVHQPERLRSHKGIIVANHSSFLDASSFASIMPVRYLAAIEVRKRPLTGWVAKLIGVVFVSRNDLNSRSKASSEIARAMQAHPNFPIVIFPEGRIGKGKFVGEFQRGAFWLAIKNGIPILPCAIEYEPEEIAIWNGKGDDSFTATLWPLLRYPAGVRATIRPLEVIHPNPEDDPTKMAFDVRRQISQTIGFTE